MYVNLCCAGSTIHTLNKEDFIELGNKTNGYSGSDISNVVRDAIMQPIRTLQGAQFFKPVMVTDANTGESVEKWEPCSPGDAQAVEKTLADIGPGTLAVPPITRYDFDKALVSVKPSVSFKDIEEHIKFTTEFGQEGN